MSRRQKFGMRQARVRRRSGGDDDKGTALIMVLVLVIVASMIVIPLLSYAISVMRANQVLGDRTVRAEAVKAGFRHAMAEPYELFDKCGGAGLNVAVTLPSPQLSLPTRTRCFLVDTASALEADELPYSVATTYVGKVPPSGPGVINPVYSGSGAAPATTWLNASSPTFTADTVWLPNLPVHGLNLRSALGYEMMDGYELNGYTECTVYFPGTYKSEVVLDGPTFFASGIYYFERQVTIAGNADVVVGEGSLQGCADNQSSAFYATGAPVTHNITGLGATFVFGEEGRLVTDSTLGTDHLSHEQALCRRHRHRDRFVGEGVDHDGQWRPQRGVGTDRLRQQRDRSQPAWCPGRVAVGGAPLEGRHRQRAAGSQRSVPSVGADARSRASQLLRCNAGRHGVQRQGRRLVDRADQRWWFDDHRLRRQLDARRARRAMSLVS